MFYRGKYNIAYLLLITMIIVSMVIDLYWEWNWKYFNIIPFLSALLLITSLLFGVFTAYFCCYFALCTYYRYISIGLIIFLTAISGSFKIWIASWKSCQSRLMAISKPLSTGNLLVAINSQKPRPVHVQQTLMWQMILE